MTPEQEAAVAGLREHYEFVHEPELTTDGTVKVTVLASNNAGDTIRVRHLIEFDGRKTMRQVFS